MVKGLDAFSKRWKAIPKAARINVRAAMEEAANDIVEEMWTLAPFKEGDLADSIGWTWGDAPEGALIIGTVGRTEYATMRITIYAGGDDAFHARFQEFGTSKMPANPFFFPVWRVRKKRFKNRVSRALRTSIRRS